MRLLASSNLFLSRCTWCCRTARHVPLYKYTLRRASYIARPRLREHIEHVRVGNSGSITLRILEPLPSPSTRGSEVILYLPPGPVFTQFPSNNGFQDSFTGDQNAVDSAKLLASASLSTTVTVNYRLGQKLGGDGKSTFRFPAPIHDTLAGFDWVFQNINPPRINVFGKHIGGSLALMLALTEPQSIAAVAAQDPVCDWVGLDDHCIVESDEKDTLPKHASSTVHERGLHDHKKRGRKRKPQKPLPADLVPLLKARNVLFHAPQNYFDPFASPALFLRTAGKYCPTKFPAVFTGPNYPVPLLKPPKERDLWTLTASMLEKEEAEAEEDVPDSAKHIVRRRKTLTRWPPVGLDYGSHPSPNTGYKEAALNTVVLPNVRVFIHSNLYSKEAQTERQPTLTDAVDALSSQLETTTLSPDEQVDSYPEDKPQSASSRRGRHSSPRGSLPDLSKLEEETILAAQGAEMVHLMHSACFWGREKGFGENRVTLVRVPYSSTSSTGKFMGDTQNADNFIGGDGHDVQHQNTAHETSVSVEEQAGEWFLSIPEAECGKDGSE
uniref:Alpha/beta hydrolase fold-3 domain-containing protein n=1 Tax=Coccidioides posadasii RMSCC 3488 TaxID=454284 RepID=A0A0J6I217_COCPO|nr:hypothetical protein CPAG_01703 [Coccidioides posadasii RMSCC 3488]